MTETEPAADAVKEKWNVRALYKLADREFQTRARDTPEANSQAGELGPGC